MKWWTYLSVACALLLSSCEKKPDAYRPQKQHLRLNIKSEPLSLDPRKPNDTISAIFFKMCFDGLTRLSLDNKLELSLAEKIDLSPDQKTYTILLKNANWSDGQPITAFDFENSWKTRLDPTFPCEAVTDLFIIKNAKAAKFNKCSSDLVGIKAIDERTLQVVLDHPSPYFLSMLSTFTFYAVPSHIVSKYPEWADNLNIHYVGNGPFSLKKMKQSDHLLLEKNAQYWDKEHVKLDQITLFVVEDETTELSMYDNAELDWAGSPLSSLPIDALPFLKNVHTYSMAGIYYYTINTKDPVLKSKNLRQALARAINRKELIENVTQSGQRPAMCFIPPSLCKEEKDYFQDADISGAKKYLELALKELNMTLQELPAITLSYNTMNSHHKIAQAIQGQWRDVLGIKVKLENKEWKVYLDELRHHNFQIGRMGGIANNLDPVSFLDRFRFLSSDENYSQWTNPEFTELLEQADNTLDENTRTEILLKAETIFMENMPVIPIYFYTGSYLKKPYVKDVYISELSDVDFKWSYVETK